MVNIKEVRPADPALLLGDIRALIDTARQRAAASVNSELTMLYLRIGNCRITDATIELDTFS